MYADRICFVKTLGKALGESLAFGDEFGRIALDVPGTVLKPVGKVGPFLESFEVFQMSCEDLFERFLLTNCDSRHFPFQRPLFII